MPHYAIHYSDACAARGSGQCDGFIPDGEVGGGQNCTCPCHDASDLPATVEGVKAWHDRFHDVQPVDTAPRNAGPLHEALLARETFAKAAAELVDAWERAGDAEIVGGSRYPFGEDFAEVAAKIRHWAG